MSHKPCPPEVVERGLQALAEGLRRERPGHVIDVLPAEDADPSDAIVTHEAPDAP